MAHSKHLSCKLPPDLSEAAELRSKSLGYASYSAYVKGLIRYDCLVQGDHSITLPLSHLRPVEQDSIDAKLLRMTRNGKGERGQFLAHIVERVKGEPAKVASEIAKEPRKFA